MPPPLRCRTKSHTTQSVLLHCTHSWKTALNGMSVKFSQDCRRVSSTLERRKTREEGEREREHCGACVARNYRLGKVSIKGALTAAPSHYN
jgi:hypothetical protein